MTAQNTLHCLPVNYPKPITAKLLNTQSQDWIMMLFLHAMHQPITGLGNDTNPEYNATNTPYVSVARSSKRQDGMRVETSMVP